MEELISEMKVALATAFTYQLKAHYYHWNVEGPDFPQYHELLGKIYQNVHDSVDKFAEEIRALDAYAPGSYTRFSELSLVEEDNTLVPANIMIMLDNSGSMNWALNSSSASSLEYPIDVAVDSSGNIYALEYFRCRVVKYNSS